MYYPMSDYRLKGFERAGAANKKYNAILVGKATGREHRVPFGDARYQQYRDSTGLGLYTRLDHGDSTRRASYRSRHAKDVREANYSAGYFPMKYLW